MNLYEINRAIADCLDLVNPETGEISEDAFSNLECLEMEQAEKVLSIAKWIKNMSAEFDALDNEIKTMQARKKLVDNKIERVKSYLVSAVPGKQFRDAQAVISWRSSKSVEVINPDELPEELVRVKIEKAPDKTLIKKYLENGMDLNGAARIVETQNIQIK